MLIRKKVFEFLANKLPIEEMQKMLNATREKKGFCVPTHLTEAEALHVADQAGEREWSNSKYIRHLIQKDMQRHLTDSYLSAESVTQYTKQFEQNERNQKSPSARTDEPNIQ